MRGNVCSQQTMMQMMILFDAGEVCAQVCWRSFNVNQFLFLFSFA